MTQVSIGLSPAPVWAGEAALRGVLALASLFIVFTGINVAFGGIETLGLQGSRDFVAVTDATAFAAQDSHVRFFGGVWLGLGLLFSGGAVRLNALRPVLYVACALIFLGGLARFSALRPDVLFGPQLVGSLGAELIGMPLLAFWMWRTARRV